MIFVLGLYALRLFPQSHTAMRILSCLSELALFVQDPASPLMASSQDVPTVTVQAEKGPEKKKKKKKKKQLRYILAARMSPQLGALNI